MVDYGVNDKGFNIKPLNVIVQEVKSEMSNITDPETGETLNNVNDDSILGQMTGIFCSQISNLWQLAQVVYGCLDPKSANDAALRSLVQLNGLELKSPSYSEFLCTATGIPNITITDGSIVSDEAGNYPCKVVGSHIIGSDGTIEFNVICQVQGAFDFEPGFINTIQTGTYGWNSVMNKSTISIGSDQETNRELRLRQQKSTANTSYRQIEAIRAAVANLTGVQYARAYLNSTLSDDDRGIPGKSIAVVVVGGYDEDIANAIFLKAPAGLNTYGTSNVTLYDDQDIAYNISFIRPTLVPIYMNIGISVTDSSIFPSDYADQIKQNIINYVTIGDENGDGVIQPGQEVISSRLITPINYVRGFSIDSFNIGTDPDSMSEQNIKIKWDEYANFNPDNINISVVGNG